MVLLREFLLLLIICHLLFLQQGKRVNPPKGKVMPLKLILDIVPSSSADGFVKDLFMFDSVSFESEGKPPTLCGCQRSFFKRTEIRGHLYWSLKKLHTLLTILTTMVTYTTGNYNTLLTLFTSLFSFS